MACWIIPVVWLILGYRILPNSADNNLPPVINNPTLFTQPSPTTTAQIDSDTQILPSTSIETQRIPTTKNITAATNPPKLAQFRPGFKIHSAIEFPKISNPGPVTGAPQLTTTRPPPATEPLLATRAPLVTEAPTLFSTTNASAAPKIEFSSTPSATLSTNDSRMSSSPSLVTQAPTIFNSSSSATMASNVVTASTINPNLQITQFNRTTSGLPRMTSFPPKLQTLKPQTRLKDARCSNNTDCNNGVCVDGQCFCAPGFTGFRCQINVNECSPNPCFNNATCIDKTGEYECVCSPGYTGLQCESEINMCQDNPCANNATCVNFVSRYECHCQDGFKGENCEINIDDCYSKPCLNNGNCIDGISKYTCDCTSTGYKGDHCETNIDDCESNPCGPASRNCVDQVKAFNCECHDGFTGTNCEIDIKECEKSPCLNGGTCIEKSQNLFRDGFGALPKNLNYSQYAGYKCECPEEYHGFNCEDKKKCYTRPHIELCGNPSAQCIDNSDGSYDCQINASFDGTDQHYAEYSLVKEFKKFKLDDIKVKYKSVKGGVILSFSTSQPSLVELYLNDTGIYFNGTLTELGVADEYKDLLDGREKEFRLNFETPLDINRIYLARSLTDQNPFKGCLMQVKLNNHLLPFYSYGEEANQDFGIKHISMDNDCRVCFENDCMNGGMCENNMEGFSCSCPSAFTGLHCEEDVNECRSFPCMNGQCENRLGGYKCNCPPGFSGENCQDVSNICLAKRPCQTGTCKSNGSLSFSCDCPSSHIGKKCEIERTCFNECNDKHSQCIQNKTCACLPGINHRMENAMCEAISSCDRHEGPLCQNGGTCSNLKGDGYECICPEGFQGSICQFRVALPQFDVILLSVIICIISLLAICAIVSLMIFRRIRRARATQGTYSPQSEEIYGDSARFDILKLPPEERLI